MRSTLWRIRYQGTPCHASLMSACDTALGLIVPRQVHRSEYANEAKYGKISANEAKVLRLAHSDQSSDVVTSTCGFESYEGKPSVFLLDNCIGPAKTLLACIPIL
ncbi:unnamed protein product [Protopolystoma xenopodis]|uniref:Uncharacterized protein n=1 Tax=Protopolystoma xenopodis TaxID=117903 RepID=A0A3S4ZZ26_9PLAT|nr:unnamed protein product [Protopolystoma xenopodis]